MGKEKMYLISESELKELLYSTLTLTALESGGVDSWSWYGESISEFISEWKEDHNIPEDEEIYIENIVEDHVKQFKEVKE